MNRERDTGMICLRVIAFFEWVRFGGVTMSLIY